MLFAESLTGIILIICGILVKINPDLIAGYNTLSEADKKKVDIKRLSTYMHNGLIIIGAVSIIAAIIMFFIGIKASYRLMSISAFIVLGILYMALNSTKMKT